MRIPDQGNVSLSLSFHNSPPSFGLYASTASDEAFVFPYVLDVPAPYYKFGLYLDQEDIIHKAISCHFSGVELKIDSECFDSFIQQFSIACNAYFSSLLLEHNIDMSSLLDKRLSVRLADITGLPLATVSEELGSLTRDYQYFKSNNYNAELRGMLEKQWAYS